MITFNLRKLLYKRHLSITEFSEMTKISRPALSKLSTGKTQGVQFDTLNKIVETLQNYDNEEATTLNKDYTSATTILHDLLIYEQDEVRLGFIPLELIEMPTFNLFDSSVVICEYDQNGLKYFDSFGIKFAKSDNVDENKKVLNFTIHWVGSKELKYYMRHSKSLSDYAGFVPMSRTTDYKTMYHLNSNSIELDTKFIFSYLNDSVTLRKSKFSDFDSFRFTKNYYINDNFMDLNKNFFTENNKKLRNSISVNCNFTWKVQKNNDSFLNNKCSYSFEFFDDEGTDDALKKAKHYTFGN